MCSVFEHIKRRLRNAVIAAVAGAAGLVLAAQAVAATAPAAANSPLENVLRVAADPNNLPFSNDRLEGFENQIAALIARDLGARLQYVWRAQRRGFFRETLKEGDCQLVMGVPAGFELALPTRPYYRSTYVFVSRTDRHLNLNSFDDARLALLKIGVQLAGADGINTPPAHALVQRGIITNVVGFTLYGNYAEANPPARIVDAVAGGDIDIAVVWGPLAGYFAARETAPLSVTPLSAEREGPLQFAFDICVGVRKRDRALRDRVDEVLARRRAEVQKILVQYGVPCLEPASGRAPELPHSERRASPPESGSTPKLEVRPP